MASIASVPRTASSATPARPWIICQLGAREHYAVARMIHSAGRLDGLLTDAWVPPGSPWRWLPPQWVGRLQERFHPELANARAEGATAGLACFEARRRLRRRADIWDTIMARNEWFGAWLRTRLTQLPDAAVPRVLFAYSYAARPALEVAKQRGWTTVLGQIDPGPVEAEIVVEEHRRCAALGAGWQAPPPAYWANWREECRLADFIVANSPWSRAALAQADVSAQKIRVIPLAFEPALSASPPRREYPTRFCAERPLRVLFLGQVNLRKGVARLLDAARELRSEPARFHMVGPVDLARPPSAAELPNVVWHGPVRRQAAARHYRDADVFLFPTLSDGFGLTQLEALAQRLPVIATRRCGEVVRHDVNGLILEDESPAAIVRALRDCLHSPGLLARLAEGTGVPAEFAPARVREHFLALGDAAAPG